MAQGTHRENLVKVKTELADKYERLARTRRSKPAKLRLLRHSKRFRSQASNARKGISK
jgi:hypothetical protein